MAKGGKRIGGKPKGYKAPATLDKIAAREAVRAFVVQRMQGMLEAQAASAEGANQFVYRDDAGRFKVIDDPDELKACISQGKAIRIFTRLPSTPAFTDLMNRALDKPAEQEQQHEHKGTIILKHELG